MIRTRQVSRLPQRVYEAHIPQLPTRDDAEGRSCEGSMRRDPAASTIGSLTLICGERQITRTRTCGETICDGLAQLHSQKHRDRRPTPSTLSPPNPDLVEAPPGTDILKLHEGLRKAESSLAIQLRTGTNGLDAFLFQARVPSVSSPLCSCGRGRQTAKHVLIFCPRHAGTRHELRDDQGHLPDFSKLLGTAEGLRKTTKWVMQRGILGQFRGARDAL